MKHDPRLSVIPTYKESIYDDSEGAVVMAIIAVVCVSS